MDQRLGCEFAAISPSDTATTIPRSPKCCGDFPPTLFSMRSSGLADAARHPARSHLRSFALLQHPPVDQRNFDAPVLLPSLGGVIRRHWSVLGAARGDEPLGRDAGVLQEAHYRGGARSRQFPVRRKYFLQALGYRHVVGVADDADCFVLVALERLRDLLQDLLAGVLQVRA